MRTLEQNELNEVSGAGLFSDAGTLLDTKINQIGALLAGDTKPSGPHTVGVEVGNIVESTFNSLVSLFYGFFQRK